MKTSAVIIVAILFSLVSANAADPYIVGVGKASLGKYAEAVVDFSEAIRTNPKHPRAYVHRAIAQFALNQRKQALDDLNTAIAIRPTDIEALNERGIVHVFMGEHAEAIKDFTEALRVAPNYFIATYNRGVARQESKDTDGAIKDFTDAIAGEPKFADAYYRRGSIYYFLDKPKALKDLQEAKKLLADPSYQQEFPNELPTRRLKSLTMSANIDSLLMKLNAK